MRTKKHEKWLKPNNLILLEGWARSGLTDEQLAHNMGISRNLLWKWKKNPECKPIVDAISKGKEIVDFEVENALLQKALHGDTTAQIFWLKNRRPELWRDKRIVEDHVEFENDGFIDALKKQSGDTFKEGEGIVEE